MRIIYFAVKITALFLFISLIDISFTLDKEQKYSSNLFEGFSISIKPNYAYACYGEGEFDDDCYYDEEEWDEIEVIQVVGQRINNDWGGLGFDDWYQDELEDIRDVSEQIEDLIDQMECETQAMAGVGDCVSEGTVYISIAKDACLVLVGANSAAAAFYISPIGTAVVAIVGGVTCISAAEYDVSQVRSSCVDSATSEAMACS